jgi:antitoxin component YwqK of YwqJK toxin-antitoxin module
MIRQIITNYPNFEVESVKEYHNGILVYEQWYDEYGNKITFHPNGQVQIRYIYNDKGILEKIIFYEENGQIKTEKIFLNDLEETQIKKEYISGILDSETHYVKNKENPNRIIQNGPFKKWFKNGQIHIQANYLYGELNGNYFKWDENGKLKNKILYVAK